MSQADSFGELWEELATAGNTVAGAYLQLLRMTATEAARHRLALTIARVEIPKLWRDADELVRTTAALVIALDYSGPRSRSPLAKEGRDALAETSDPLEVLGTAGEAALENRPAWSGPRPGATFEDDLLDWDPKKTTEELAAFRRHYLNPWEPALGTVEADGETIDLDERRERERRALEENPRYKVDRPVSFGELFGGAAPEVTRPREHHEDKPEIPEDPDAD